MNREPVFSFLILAILKLQITPVLPTTFIDQPNLRTLITYLKQTYHSSSFRRSSFHCAPAALHPTQYTRLISLHAPLDIFKSSTVSRLTLIVGGKKGSESTVPTSVPFKSLRHVIEADCSTSPLRRGRKTRRRKKLGR